VSLSLSTGKVEMSARMAMEKSKFVCVCVIKRKRECVKETNTYFQDLLQPREFDTVVSLILVLIIMPKFYLLILFLLKLYN